MLLQIGSIIRPHGLKGEVVVALVTNRTERLAPGTRLVARKKQRADPVKSDASIEQGHDEHVLEVVSSRPQQHRYLVHFLGVKDRDAAEALRDVELFAEAESVEGELMVHELIGCELIDQYGTRRGSIQAVEANPASDLLVVDGRYYVPLRFVRDFRPGEVEVEVPEGLFDDL